MSGRTPASLVPLLLLAALLAGAASTRGRQARYLNFSARDRHQIYLPRIRLEEVALYLDGKPVGVRFLGGSDVDTAYIFLLENSPRTAPFAKSFPQLGQVNILDQVRAHLENGFFGPLVEQGSVLLAQFYRSRQVLHDFTSYDDQLEYALRRMTPHASGLDTEHIPLGRMIGWGVDQLRARPERRKILVLFTTTVDRESHRNLEEMRQFLRANDVDLYVISFALRFPTGPGHTYLERINRFYFRQLVSETAGRAYISGEYRYIDEFMGDLASRLAHTWTIGFYVHPSDPPGEHSVRLELARPGVKLDYRKRIEY